jgi:hypothetical protein
MLHAARQLRYSGRLAVVEEGDQKAPIKPDNCNTEKRSDASSQHDADPERSVKIALILIAYEPA